MWTVTVSLNPENPNSGLVTAVYEYAPDEMWSFSGQYDASQPGVLAQIVSDVEAAKAAHDEIRTLEQQYATAIANQLNN